MAAIAIATIAGAPSGIAVTSVTSGIAMAFTAGRGYLAQASWYGTNTNVTPTLSGGGQTWELVAVQHFNYTGSSYVSVAVWRALGVTDTQTITFDWGATTVDVVQTGTCEITGDFDLSGAHFSGAITQSAGGGANSSTPGATLASFADAVNNACFLAAAYIATNGATPDGSLLELRDFAADSLNNYTAWQLGEDTTPSCSITTGSPSWAAIAIEIKAAVAGATIPKIIGPGGIVGPSPIIGAGAGIIG